MTAKSTPQPSQDLPAEQGSKGRDNAAARQADNDARKAAKDDKRQTAAEQIEQARKDAAAGDHGDNPVVDVHGLPLPGDPQLAPDEVQTVGGVVTDDGGRPVSKDAPTTPTSDKA
jgi:hypothetical protein